MLTFISVLHQIGFDVFDQLGVFHALHLNLHWHMVVYRYDISRIKSRNRFWVFIYSIYTWLDCTNNGVSITLYGGITICFYDICIINIPLLTKSYIGSKIWIVSDYRKAPRADIATEDQIVVTPVHPGVKMKSSQMNDVNTDYANRSGFHQTHTMEQSRFKWILKCKMQQTSCI